jgi:hypothetical protein
MQKDIWDTPNLGPKKEDGNTGARAQGVCAWKAALNRIGFLKYI